MPIFRSDSDDDASLEIKGLTATSIGAIPVTQKGVPGGVASLGTDGRVPAAQLPNWSELLTANLQATDALAIQIENLPPPPTLTSLGGEPVGAEVRAKAYTDQKINAIATPTAAQVGAIANSEKGSAGGVATLGSDTRLVMAQLPAYPTWIALPLVLGWSNYAQGYADASYCKDPYGDVRLRGCIKGGGNGVIGNLPVGYRPTTHIGFRVLNAGNNAFIIVLSSGDLFLNCDSNANVHLNQIRFPLY